MRSAGIAKCEWAVEIDEPAARSFQKNNSEATVFVEDCNNFLKMVMNVSVYCLVFILVSKFHYCRIRAIDKLLFYLVLDKN